MNYLSAISNECPSTHPWAYYNGDYCCKNDKEKVKSSYGDTCDGSKISLTSLCCLNDEYVECEHPDGCINYKGRFSTCIFTHELLVVCCTFECFLR